MAITSPSDISDLAVWLNAGQGVTKSGGSAAANNDTVAGWADQFGTGKTVTVTGSPVYKTNVYNGQPCVRFNGDGARVVVSSAFSAANDTALTLFVVNKFGTGFTVSHGAGSGTEFVDAQIDNQRWLQLAGLSKKVAGTHTSLTVEEIRKGPSAIRLRCNGAGGDHSHSSDLNLEGAVADWRFGGFSSGFNLSGDIAEAISYNRTLTDTEVLDVRQYLLSKYGLTADPDPLIVFHGDSITFGFSASGPSTTYPSVTRSLLGSSSWMTDNQGVSGRTIQTIAGLIGTALSDVKRTGTPRNVVCVLGGVNDASAGRSTSQILADIESACLAARSAGFTVLVGTLLDCTGFLTFPGGYSGFATDRATINASIRSNYLTYADAVMDFAADSRIGANGAADSATYFADKLHPTDAGNAIMAEIAADAVRSLFGSVGGPGFGFGFGTFYGD